MVIFRLVKTVDYEITQFKLTDNFPPNSVSTPKIDFMPIRSKLAEYFANTRAKACLISLPYHDGVIDIKENSKHSVLT